MEILEEVALDEGAGGGDRLRVEGFGGFGHWLSGWVQPDETLHGVREFDKVGAVVAVEEFGAAGVAPVEFVVRL
jgi:hypothetical protein